MKLLFTIYIFAFSISLSVGQSLPPTGAQWHYNLTINPFIDNSGMNEYILLEAVKDTIVQDSTCKKISVNYYNRNNQIIYLGDEYLKVTNDKVYNYHHGKFFLLYDYSKNIGDTLDLKLGCNSTLFSRLDGWYEDTLATGFEKHKVIDKDSIEISGKKYLYITYQGLDRKAGSTYMSGNIIQGIGSIDFLFGGYFSPIETDIYGPLRCFNSSSLSFQQGSLSCDSITDVLENGNLLMNIFPVPINGTLTVSLNGEVIKEISIYNSLGEIVFSSVYNSSSITINVDQFEKGIYFLKIKTNNDLIVKKIIKW